MIVEDTFLLIIGAILSVVALIMGVITAREIVQIARDFISNMSPV